MKVLHIINSPGLGGAETMVKDIVAHFPDHKVFCLRRDEKNRFAELGDRAFYGVEHDGNYKYNPKILWKLVRTVYREKPEVLHIHLANSLAYGLGVRLVFPRIKFIYHEHGEIIYNNSSLAFLIRSLGASIPKVIAVSDCLRRALLKQNKGMDVSVLKNYTDVKYFSDLASKKRETTKIGFAGRLIQMKGCDVLLRAVARTKNNVSVCIYGDGPERDALGKLAKEIGVSQRVFFKGYESDRKKIYSELDILVVPSRMEAAGLVNLEARAAGCIVVASKVGGIPEYIEDGLTGFLFEKENYIELAKILDSIAENAELRVKVVSQSLAEVKQYDISLYMEHLEELYRSL